MSDAAAARRRVTIVNEKGLHARAATRFVKLAESFEAAILVSRAGISVDATSIMGLLMLAAAPGSDIELSARGKQARAALDALVALVSRGFDEGVQ